MGFSPQRPCWRAIVVASSSAGLLTGWLGSDVESFKSFIRESGMFQNSDFILLYSHPQIKATGPQILASNIQHNFPDSACSRHGTYFPKLFSNSHDTLLSRWYLLSKSILRLSWYFALAMVLPKPIFKLQIPIHSTLLLPWCLPKSFSLVAKI